MSANHPKTDPRPALGGWCPGGYLNRCKGCGEYYLGDKRCWQCADCAYDAPLKAAQEAEAQGQAEDEAARTAAVKAFAA